MKCPYCGFPETKVVDKRDAEGGDAARRRRECLKCGERFTTYERVETSTLTVVKKDGTREQFDREKVLRGIIKACEKRPISRDMMERTADEIEVELRNGGTKEVTSKEVGELVMRKLRKLDKIAYIRFASVYREFTDLSSFEKELKKLIRK